MSNYHVEPADKPQALTTEALKAVRPHQVQGVSRRELLRGSLAAGMGLWLLELTRGPSASCGRTSRASSAARSGSALWTRIAANSARPINEGFPAYDGGAKAFVILVDPSQQRFIPGEDDTGDGTTSTSGPSTSAAPHLGCKPNPCLKNFWLECPCHGSRYDRLGIKARAPSTARRRAAWTASASRSATTGPDRRHRQDHAGPAAHRRRAAPASSRRARRTGCI